MKLTRKNKKYYMDVLCAVEHLEKVITERVPMGDRGEVTADIIDRLVFGKKEVDYPDISFKYLGEAE